MGNTVVIGLELQDNGSIKQKTNETKQLNQELANTNKSAKAAFAQTASRTYDQARAGGGTGAAGRDFAKESQGLGGLVRVYATFAANVFAVSAAFNALKNAADTTSLVEGLNQIGAASGRNLGSLAKQMVAATDGALSLRDAMASTAIASSGGMTNSAILRMTEVAKKASIALGRDMSDSMERLTKGIIKIQPELLDELGIMTRVIPSQQEYARQLGKSVSALTDFEKRQAFANAVLTEGEKKFNAINIDSNPYSKLLATIKDVSFATLELINKGLGPIAKLLGESPTALMGILGLITVGLLKQAIPAVSNWQKGLAEATKEAAAHAQEVSDVYDHYKSGIIEKDVSKQAVAYKSAANAAKDHASTLTKLEGINLRTKVGKGLVSLADDPSSISKAADLEAERIKRIKTLQSEATKNISVEKAVAIQAELTGLKKLEFEIKNLIALQNQLNQASKAYTPVAGGYFGIEARQQRNLAKARSKEKSTEIVGGISQSVGDIGVIATTGATIGKIKDSFKTLGNAGSIFTAIKSGAVLAYESVALLGSLLSEVAFIVGVVVTAASFLNDWFTSNAKESDNFSKSIDVLESSFSNVDRTIDVIRAKDPLERLSITSISAIATAFDDLTGSLDKTITSFDKLKAVPTNIWDKVKEGLYSLFGKDSVSILSENLSKSIGESIKLLETSGDEDKFKTAISSILKIDKFDTASIKKSLSNLDTSAQVQAINELNKVQKSNNTELNNGASRLQSYKEAIDNTTKAHQELLNSYNLTDPLAKFGTGLLTTANNMQLLTNSNKESQAAVLDLLNSTEKMSAVGGEFAAKLITIREEYLSSTSAVKEYTDRLKEAKASYEALKTKQGSSGPIIYNSATSGLDVQTARQETGLFGSKARERTELYVARRNIEANQRVIDEQLKVQNEGVISAQKVLAEGMQQSFIKGAELIEQALGNASAKAAITIAKGGLGGLTGTAAIQAETKLSNMETSIQLKSIEVIERQIIETQLLNNNIEKANLLADQARTTDKDKLAQIARSLITNELVNTGLTGGTKTRSAIIRAAKDTSKEDVLGSVATAGRQLATVDIQLKGTDAQRKQLAAQKESVRLANIYRLAMANLAETTIVDLNFTKARLAIDAERLDIIKGIVGYDTEQMAQIKGNLDLEIQKKNAFEEQVTIQAKIDAIEKQRSEKGLQSLTPELEREQTLLRTALSKANSLDLDKQANITLKTSVSILKTREDRLTKELELKTAIRNLDNQVLNNMIDIQDAQDNRAQSLGLITEDERANRGYVAASSKLQNEYNKKQTEEQDKLNSLTEKYAAATQAVNNEKSLAQQALDEEFTRTMKLNNIAKLANQDDFESRSKILELGKRINDEDEKALARQIELKQSSRALTSTIKSGELDIIDAQAARSQASGKITEDQKNQSDYATSIARIEADTANKRLAQQENFAKEKSKFDKQFEAMQGDTNLSLNEEYLRRTQINADTLKGIDAEGAARLKIAEINKQLTTQEQAIQGLILNGVNNLSDAFVEFALTGKQSFGDMVQSMIMDLAKLELRMMFMKSLKEAGGTSGLLSMFTSLFTGGSSAPTGVTAGFDPMTVFKAKGAAYDSGVQTFAKGGTFTNSVVSSPTLFKFAKGTGLMGEAGPEAIMPLKRGADGSLGVEGGAGGQTSVVVNNYSTAQAETKESVDSRGNRKIEVTIGEITAGEMARSGSASQKTMRSTFGMAPQLIRR